MKPEFDDIKKAIKNLECNSTTIVVCHPEFVRSLDMSSFEKNIWFLAYPHVAFGDAIVLTPESYEHHIMYSVCCAYPKMCRKGNKIV